MTTDRHQRLTALFHELCALPEGERKDRLHTHCAEDETLYDDVRSLVELDAPSEVGSPVQVSRDVLQVFLDHCSSMNFEDNALPETIGSFRILRHIGSGAMAQVYEAEQESPRRTVAVKVMNRSPLAHSVRRRFEFETHILAKLTHPGIAQIYDASTYRSDGFDRPYFAMEFVRGASLLDHTESLGLSIKERLALFARICDAVQYAHQQAVIHRDLKPANILVTDDGDPKVLDFGVARLIDSDIQYQTVATATGQLIGTLRYMSPEQAAGETDAVDTRSDIYALGVILYELLTGRLPYDVRDNNIVETLRSIQEDEPKRIGTLNKALRGDVETIVETVLAKEKDRRYQTAAELAGDIRHVLQNEPITARRTGRFYRFKKFVRRNRTVTAAAVITTITLVTGTIFSWKQASIAKEQLRQKIIAVDESNAVVDYLRELLERGRTTELGVSASILDVLNHADETISERFADSPLVEARVQFMLGRIYEQYGMFDAAYDKFEASWNLFKRVNGITDRRTLTSRCWMARTLTDARRHDEVESFLPELIQQCHETLGADHEVTIFVDGIQAYRALIEPDYDRAMMLFQSLIKRQRRVFGDTNSQTLDSIAKLAQLHWYRDQKDRALQLQNDLCALTQSALGATHPDTINAQTNKSVMLRGLGRHEESEQVIVTTIQARRSMTPKAHIDFRRDLIRLGDVRRLLGRFEDATGPYEELLSIQREHFPPDHRFTLEVLHSLGQCYWQLKDYDRAVPLLEEHLALRRAALPDEHEDVYKVWTNVARGKLYLGKVSEALIAYKALVPLYREHAPNELIRPLAEYGEALRQDGRPDAAQEALQEALMLAETNADNSSADDLRYILKALLAIATSLGDLEAAAEYQSRLESLNDNNAADEES